MGMGVGMSTVHYLCTMHGMAPIVSLKVKFCAAPSQNTITVPGEPEHFIIAGIRERSYSEIRSTKYYEIVFDGENPNIQSQVHE
jgi:hypothetical protein